MMLLTFEGALHVLRKLRTSYLLFQRTDSHQMVSRDVMVFKNSKRLTFDRRFWSYGKLRAQSKHLHSPNKIITGLRNLNWKPIAQMINEDAVYRWVRMIKWSMGALFAPHEGRRLNG